MTNLHELDFTPFWGLSSKHLQMIVSAYLPLRKAPPSKQLLVDIGDNDKLSCEVSTPPSWDHKMTIAMLHGLGGNQSSRYMIRMARLLYENGYQVVRINYRGCGSGEGLSKLPCGAGNSQDVLKVLQYLKQETPSSDITLIGFSLGGNTSLKLAGELGDDAGKWIKKIIAVCPPLDLKQTEALIRRSSLYNHYYLKRIRLQSKPWIKQKIHSIYEYDDKITGPLSGFSGAEEYYKKCSSIHFLPKIKCNCHLIFAKDDPFISLDALKGVELPDCVHIWTSKHGSHLGFLGRSHFQWLDQLLLDWIKSSD